MVERHRPYLLRGFIAVVGSLLAGCSGMGTLQPGLHATVQHEHHTGCRDGMCDPHCPVRPGVQGFYETQWRRWPTTKTVDSSSGEAATPAEAPRSIVPRPDEESAQQEIQSLPSVDQPSVPPRTAPDLMTPPPPSAPAAPPRSSPPEDDNLFSSREAAARASLLASTAAAARTSEPADQVKFTRRLAETLLTEHDGSVRARMVQEASTFQTPAADAICRGAADDPDPRVRNAGCGAWKRRGGPEAVRFLAERAAKDADLEVRLRAIRCLGELRDPSATAALVRMLDDADRGVQNRVCEALGRATGLALGDDPQRWRQWAAQASAAQPRF